MIFNYITNVFIIQLKKTKKQTPSYQSYGVLLIQKLYPGPVVQRMIIANPKTTAPRKQRVMINLVFLVNGLLTHMYGNPIG